jgi:hypothetical protein
MVRSVTCSRSYFPLVNFPGFTEHCKVFRVFVLLFQAVFCEVPVLPDNPLEQHCPLSISLVVDWVEDLITLGVFELCRDEFGGCAGMSCMSCSMSAVFMQEGKYRENLGIFQGKWASDSRDTKVSRESGHLPPS